METREIVHSLPSRGRSSPLAALIVWVLVLAGLTVAFWQTFANMWLRWFPAWGYKNLGLYDRIVEGESYYTHGPLIPLVSGLIALLLIRHTRIPVRPSPVLGSVVLGGSLLLHLTSTLARVNFASAFSLVGVLAGLVQMSVPGIYLRRTKLTAVDEEIRELADGIEAPDRLTWLHALSEHLHETLDYRPGATDSTTTAAETLAVGAGVCQDYAHLFIAACRTRDIPARYFAPGAQPDDHWGTAFYGNLVHNFCEEIVAGGEVNQGDFAQSARVQEIINAVALSHRERRWVDLPLGAEVDGGQQSPY